MHTLFLGNLPFYMTEASLRELFRRTKIDVISVQVRQGGIAFAHCPDQNSADRAIEVLNGYRFSGVPIRVEPSVPRHHRSSKIFIRQMPTDVNFEEIEGMVAEFGEIVNCERGNNADSATLIVTYKKYEEAEAAVERLNQQDFHGRPLKVSFYFDRSRNSRRGNGSTNDLGNRSVSTAGGMIFDRYGPRNKPPTDMPLRMVVNARLVGAIIGQGGANIRQITKDSKARCVVDVNQGIRDQSGNVEKVISIYGTPENCSKACIKILEVIQRELEKESGSETKEEAVEPELKLRAHNNLVGRLIGKAGSTLKKIMQETGSTVFVSNISELSAFNMERTITIRGKLENISQAEEKISDKLRKCWESDMANSSIYGGVHPLMAAPLTPMVDPYSFTPNIPAGFPHAVGPHQGIGRPGPVAAASLHGTPNSVMPHGAAGGSAAAHSIEVSHMWVPNSIVGALIGTKGVHIRNVIRMTGATVRIESSNDEDTSVVASNEASPQTHKARRDMDGERRVTIMGTDQQQYKAQFWVFQRICEQGYHFFDELRLCTEVQVPSKMVGRIIGKSGQNVRELQRVTGAQVKIPEDATNEENENTLVQIIGNFNASQAVQARIRQLVHQFRPQCGRSLSGDHQKDRERTPNHYAEEHQ